MGLIHAKETHSVAYAENFRGVQSVVTIV